ncbi:2,3-bisphosphoglycerate-independent phosphoglycerate mutase [Flammeovirga kamogawensis]|uniref:2,3-bisphosphoglycerate-independent phosphoglycerate mutase n=1 Tax=Flammeovirga kamogawensis TaxID=373891 RepID=A0ABX8GRE9_9BACT|nr:2,3-bisphosphoglycerate-independent phosphoglycerate mutase [Flammeovirga kamogawensis]MBB6462098.1 2,3-bisphosphoglycerate-independent phosphoglycerate mutase [Flammeovirga kamogawensis]QWG05832.1 2,3-bisphosphoglycerate-independent phosphoglycerate mutase [Flammeovirga kamogawensis]TRX67658.1 2,3-bisphosphoglycerate-independent phosphoglycerate mutase [Flammeovirga kamogawensis]
MNKKTILMILDGWGIGPDPKVSAIDQANTPFVDSLYTKYKHSKLEASGLAVGLPEGQMGNSEVGHMNLGAGRVVYQMLVRINQAVQDGSIADIQELQDAFSYAKENNKKVHFIGLVSNGGVHSHIGHLKGLLSAANAAELGKDQVFVHAFTDGRDCDPMSGKGFIQDVEQHMEKTTGQIASVVGRYNAMDRDNRWERVAKAYKVMVNAEGKEVTSITDAIQESYDNDVTDEFIEPLVNTVDGKPVAKIEEGDVVLCFNFRTDRGREISLALSQKDYPEEGLKKLDIKYLTMTMYDETYKNVGVLFHKDNLKQTLGEVLESAGKKQIRIAETEKYPHVTFFFSGGRETEFDGETRLLAPSPKVATYDLQPDMSAYDIKDKIIPELQKGDADFVCLNFANADMVGHTGIFEAAVAACEAVDSCAKAVVEAGLENGYSSIVIADHGNSDVMKNPDGSPNTAHTTNLVPCIFVDPDFDGEIKDGKLGDIAPTVLKIVGVDQPEEMTGNCLI